MWSLCAANGRAQRWAQLAAHHEPDHSAFRPAQWKSQLSTKQCTQCSAQQCAVRTADHAAQHNADSWSVVATKQQAILAAELTAY